jgi:hypothetical protein
MSSGFDSCLCSENDDDDYDDNQAESELRPMRVRQMGECIDVKVRKVLKSRRFAFAKSSYR